MVATFSPAEDAIRRSASMRRIAIVLESLPDAVAERILGQFDGPTRQRLRHEVADLVDVDPIERKRAIEVFAGSIRQSTENPVKRDEKNLGPPPPITNHNEAEVVGTFDFLSEIRDNELLAMFRNEHPQAVAVVIASMSPTRAAKLLPQMPSRQRQDLISRIGKLQTLPQDMTEEIAATFRARLDHLRLERLRNSSNGVVSADWAGAVDALSTPNATEHVPASAQAVSPALRAILAELPPATAPVSSQSRPKVIPTAPLPPKPVTAADVTPNHRSTDEIHQALVRMNAHLLCQSLARVPTRTALLALCGLPAKTSDAAIAALPRAQANQVRQQLANLDTMELREIDQAKQAVLEIAMQSRAA